jgi:16S rRNA (guanine527-N7)-methyltransferase
MWPPANLNPAQLQAFRVYIRLLVEEGSRLNLTSLKESEAIERRHFGESLALLEVLESLGAVRSPVIDIGSGAGFPGLPIKIARPDLQLTLLEATGKKTRFLELVVRELRLTDVTVVNGRAEEVAHEAAHRSAYALALARAVAPLPVLVELALPFLQVGGYLAAPKGSGAAREVREAANALRLCGGGVEAIQPLRVPGPGPAPTLVLIRKSAETPGQYPRRPGMPAKRPL